MVTCVVLTTLTGIAARTKFVHGKRQSLMGLYAKCTE